MYVQNLAKIAHPSYQLTEKLKNFFWNTKAQEEFDVLKARLNTAPVLAFPNMRELFILYTDPSHHAMGAVHAHV